MRVYDMWLCIPFLRLYICVCVYLSAFVFICRPAAPHPDPLLYLSLPLTGKKLMAPPPKKTKDASSSSDDDDEDASDSGERERIFCVDFFCFLAWCVRVFISFNLFSPVFVYNCVQKLRAQIYSAPLSGISSFTTALLLLYCCFTYQLGGLAWMTICDLILLYVCPHTSSASPLILALETCTICCTGP